MRQYVLRSIITSIALITIGCAEDSTPPQNYFDYHVPTTETEVVTQDKIMNATTITCEGGECPAHIGGIAFKVGANVSACSTQLIDGNKILTNKHCLPDELKSAGADCSGYMNFVFPETGNFPAEFHQCDKVLALTDVVVNHEVNAERPDWAVVQLKTSSSRPVAQVVTPSIEEGTEINLYPVYWVLNQSDTIPRYEGTVRKVTCKTTMTHMMGNSYINKDSAIFIGAGCNHDIIGGNSGSGVYNNDGELIAVASFAATKEFTQNINGRSIHFDNNVLGGTRAGCIPYFKNSEQSPFCFFSESDEYRLLGLSSGLAIAMGRAKEFYHDLYESIGESLDENESVYWTENNSETSARIDATGMDIPNWDELPEQLRQYHDDKINQVNLPIIPLCVKAQALENFEMKVPVVVNDNEKHTFNEVGEHELTPKVEWRNFKVSKASEDTYKAQMETAGALDRARFHRYLSQLNQLQIACEQEKAGSFFGRGSYKCDSKKMLELEINRFMRQSDMSREAISNELYLYKSGRNPMSLTLPTCGDGEEEL